MNDKMKSVLPFALCGVLLLAPADHARGEDVDFSCMSYRVWEKSLVSDRFNENDIVLKNDCPGAVYWALCIERIDPWTGEIMETHNPVGYVEPERKARVNLQLKRGKHMTGFRNRYLEFYIGTGYGIGSSATPECPAANCEAQKRELRAQVRNNIVQWDRAEKALAANLAQECPTSSWDNATREECETRVREDSLAALSVYSEKDQELRDAMAAIDPDNCQMWGGSLIQD